MSTVGMSSDGAKTAACSRASSEDCIGDISAAMWGKWNVRWVHLLVDLHAHSTLCDVPDDASSAMVHLVWHTLQDANILTQDSAAG